MHCCAEAEVLVVWDFFGKQVIDLRFLLVV